VDRSVAQGRPANPAAGGRRLWLAPIRRLWLAPARRSPAIGLLLVALAAAVYLGTQVPGRYYDHFVWQASAFLEGKAAIRYPVDASAAGPGNALFQDVLPILSSDTSPRGLLPFPPLPAVVLVPFVAIWGLATDDQTIFTILAAIDVGLCWWMLGRFRIRETVRLGTTVVFAFGTVFWYTAQLATTWYQAHIVAVGLTLLAVGLALGADPRAQDPVEDGAVEDRGAAAGAAHALGIDRRQFVAGLLLGLAATARLTVVLGAPFFVLVGAGGTRWRRGWSAALGAAIPVALLFGYNVVTTGHVFHPAYDFLYRLESRAYTALGYHPEWSAEDPRYLPQNAAIMFLTTPDVLPARLPDSLGVNDTPVCQGPDRTRGLFDSACPIAVPRDIGMSVLLTTPAFLVAVAAIRRYRRSRLVTAAMLAVVLITVVDLMHFSQGWVQFGYRFSLDWVPFALPVLALGFEAMAGGGRRTTALAAGLIGISIAVNAWGVAWGRLLGW